MSYAADDHEAIRRRMEELQAERDLALTGSAVHIQHDAGETLDYAIGWPYTAAAHDPA